MGSWSNIDMSNIDIDVGTIDRYIHTLPSMYTHVARTQHHGHVIISSNKQKSPVDKNGWRHLHTEAQTNHI